MNASYNDLRIGLLFPLGDRIGSWASGAPEHSLYLDG